MRRAEGGAKIFGVFRVENHDFRPKNHIFSNFRGGGGAPDAPRPWIRPCIYTTNRGKPTIYTVKPVLKGTSIQQITVYKELLHLTN
jgi:hypothetical protein